MNNLLKLSLNRQRSSNRDHSDRGTGKQTDKESVSMIKSRLEVRRDRDDDDDEGFGGAGEAARPPE